MGTCFAVGLRNGIFDATNALKNEKLLFCVGSGETALRARQSEIFEESASHKHPTSACANPVEVITNIENLSLDRFDVNTDNPFHASILLIMHHGQIVLVASSVHQ